MDTMPTVSDVLAQRIAQLEQDKAYAQRKADTAPTTADALVWQGAVKERDAMIQFFRTCER